MATWWRKRRLAVNGHLHRPPPIVHNTHVQCKVRGVRKCPLTDGAVVRVHSTFMQRHMSGQRFFLAERSRALLAHVVPVTSVDAAMADERRLDCEPLAAHITLVRSLPGVPQHVIIKRITACKRRRAVDAPVRLLSRVGTLVHDKTPPPHEPLPARGAGVSLLAGVHGQMVH